VLVKVTVVVVVVGSTRFARVALSLVRGIAPSARTSQNFGLTSVNTLVLKVGQNFERSSNDPTAKLLYVVICFDQNFYSHRPTARHTQDLLHKTQDTMPGRRCGGLKLGGV
jgi:hypothetical protein